MSRFALYALTSLMLLFQANLYARDGISLDQAVEDARRHGGRVISAETRESNGRRVHNIRMLTKDGRVKRIQVDGDSGQRMQGRPRR